MIFTETVLTGAFIVDIEERRDSRGLFARTYCRDEFEAHGLDPGLVQGNLSYNNRRGTLRGRRQIMLDDSDVHHHRHSKGAVGGVAAAAIGDPAVFVSVDAMHQGPQGGGPVIAIVDVGE